jgi:hypothetical protein
MRAEQGARTRRNALDQIKVGGEPLKGVVWALLYIGDQVARLVTATYESASLNREVWEHDKAQEGRKEQQ